MTTKKLALVFMLSVLIGAPPSSIVFAQAEKNQTATATKQETAKIAVTGKIAYLKYLGGYYVQGEEPAGEFMVVNQNPRILKYLMKSGKTVSIEGYLKMGADHLVIEKIDGKKYRGRKKTASK